MNLSIASVTRRRPAGLWRHPDFMKLWVAQTISGLGSGIGATAVGLTAVLVLHATPAQLGLLAALETAPFLVCSLPAGVWVDRLRRRPLLIATDLGRALLLVSIPLAAALGRLSMAQLYVVAALAGTLGVLFSVADQAFFPTVVPRERLAEGNSKVSMSESLAEIGGSSLGGTLVQVLSAPGAILVDVASFLASAWCMGRIRAVEPIPTMQGRPGLWREVWDGLRVVIGHPLLRATTGAAATRHFFGSFFAALYAVYAIRELHVPPALLGVLVAFGGVGALAGAVVARTVAARIGVGATLAGAIAVSGLAQLAIPFAGGPLIVVAVVLGATQFAGDVALETFLIHELSLRQAVIPTQYLGRANASVGFLVVGPGVPGALLAGLLGGALGLRATLLIAAFGCTASAVWIVFSPVRRLRAYPHGPHA